LDDSRFFFPRKTLDSWITNGKHTDGLINLKRRLNLEGEVAKDKIKQKHKYVLPPSCYCILIATNPNKNVRTDLRNCRSGVLTGRSRYGRPEDAASTCAPP